MTTSGRCGIYLRVSEIARLVGLNVKTVRRWIDAGKIEGSRMPAEVNPQQERRVHYEALREFLVKAGYTRTVHELDEQFEWVAPPDNAVKRVAKKKPKRESKPEPEKVVEDGIW